MQLKKIDKKFTICKVTDASEIDLTQEYCFVGKTDEELSVVCVADCVPANATERDDGWRAFRIEGVLDFSLVGILSKISTVLADNQIGIFAVSTYNTDYVLVKEQNFEKALGALAGAGYEVAE